MPRSTVAGKSHIIQRFCSWCGDWEPSVQKDRLAVVMSHVMNRWCLRGVSALGHVLEPVGKGDRTGHRTRQQPASEVKTG